MMSQPAGDVSIDMMTKMHSPEMKKKTMGGLIYGIVINATMAGIFGWWAFPSSNWDIQYLWAEKLEDWAEMDMTTTEWKAQLEEDLANDYSDADELKKATRDEAMKWWLSNFCFYTPTTNDEIINKIPEFEFDPNNANQRCVSCEFQMFIFIWFILCLVSIVVAVFQTIAFSMKKQGLFNCCGCIGGLGGCVGFVTFIIASCSRWSEAGRACSGEFWAAQTEWQIEEEVEYVDFVGLEQSCQTGDSGCGVIVGQEEGVDIYAPVATTYYTGMFLNVILILVWVSIGLGCCCACCGMMMMKNKMKTMENPPM